MVRSLSCLALVCVLLSFPQSRAAGDKDDYCNVELRGTIATGKAAVGGETTPHSTVVRPAPSGRDGR